MTTTRAFRCEDLFRFNNINLDALTETYNVSFYYMYMSTWPDYFKVEEHPSGKLMGYIMGKARARARSGTATSRRSPSRPSSGAAASGGS